MMKDLLPFANTVALTAPPYFILFSAKQALRAGLLHQAPERIII
jgi:hypothetical protein